MKRALSSVGIAVALVLASHASAATLMRLRAVCKGPVSYCQFAVRWLPVDQGGPSSFFQVQPGSKLDEVVEAKDGADQLVVAMTTFGPEPVPKFGGSCSANSPFNTSEFRTHKGKCSIESRTAEKRTVTMQYVLSAER
jgi:hypothetical protein